MTIDPGISLAAKTELLAAALREAREGDWTVTEPGFVRGPGSTAVAIRPDDSGTPSHLDLEFILNVDRREETATVDCVTGVAKDPSDAVRHAIFQWSQTTGAAVFELFEQRGEMAGHFPHDDPFGVPGWHTIGSKTQNRFVSSSRASGMSMTTWLERILQDSGRDYAPMFRHDRHTTPSLRSIADRI